MEEGFNMYEKILIVDDEEHIISFIKDALLDEGYEVFTAQNGDEAIESVKIKPDLILLDIMMPGKDGFKVCESIRNIVDCPIIFLSARGEEGDKIKGLMLGGDDYIVKPFSIRELKARVSAHLRREKRAISNNPSRLYFKELSIDLLSREVYIGSEIVNTTKREFDIIELLSLHPGQVFSREQIYEKIWGYEGEGDSSNVAEHVKNIRQKIAALSSKTDYIVTVWGVGYKWERFN